MIMTDWVWALWVGVCAAVMLRAFRAHEVGGRKTLVMALTWVAIFLIAAGIGKLINDMQEAPPIRVPVADEDPRFT